MAISRITANPLDHVRWTRHHEGCHAAVEKLFNSLGNPLRKIAAFVRVVPLCLLLCTQLAQSSDVVVTNDADSGPNTLRAALVTLGSMTQKRGPRASYFLGKTGQSTTVASSRGNVSVVASGVARQLLAVMPRSLPASNAR